MLRWTMIFTLLLTMNSIVQAQGNPMKLNSVEGKKPRYINEGQHVRYRTTNNEKTRAGKVQLITDSMLTIGSESFPIGELSMIARPQTWKALVAFVAVPVFVIGGVWSLVGGLIVLSGLTTGDLLLTVLGFTLDFLLPSTFSRLALVTMIWPRTHLHIGHCQSCWQVDKDHW
jgi:hypothetical protein